MTLLRALALSVALSTLAPAYGQEPASPVKAQTEASAGKMTVFDLDFPGGTPGELVAAIQKASGRPLNAIVPTELARTELPALKMRQVDADHLFKAMVLASQRTIQTKQFQYRSGYGFKTDGKPADDSVWYFFEEKPDADPYRVVRFYLLTPYLDEGLSVDDITTAISTGWKMSGNSKGCELSYHKETKLLIVIADQDHIDTVTLALDALKAPKPKSAPLSTGEPAVGNSSVTK